MSQGLAQTLLAYGRFRRGDNAQEDRALLERALLLFEEIRTCQPVGASSVRRVSG